MALGWIKTVKKKILQEIRKIKENATETIHTLKSFLKNILYIITFFFWWNLVASLEISMSTSISDYYTYLYMFFSSVTPISFKVEQNQSSGHGSVINEPD